MGTHCPQELAVMGLPHGFAGSQNQQYPARCLVGERALTSAPCTQHCWVAGKSGLHGKSQLPDCRPLSKHVALVGWWKHLKGMGGRKTKCWQWITHDGRKDQAANISHIMLKYGRVWCQTHLCRTKECSTMQYHNDMTKPSWYSLFLGLWEHFSCPDPDPMQWTTFGRKW